MDDFLRVVGEFEREFAGRIVYQTIVPARPPQHAEYPSFLPSILTEALQARGIHRPYTHQTLAWQILQDGKNIVVITPTASGKTLCYNVPVVRRILQDSSSRALYVFPTKALSQDQYAELQALLDHAAPEAKAFTFDGDTPADARQAIRAQGHIVITNPDMLHSGILPHHVKWQKLFENLKFVVLDELHSYRGVFGSHVSNVIRRLKRICKFYGSALFSLENVGAGELSLPEQEWHTTAFWFTIPREIWIESPFDSEEKIDGVRALAYALRSMAVIHLMCDLRDLGVAVIDTLQDRKIYQSDLRKRKPAGDAREAFQPNIYLYDKYPGGIGFSKTLFDQQNMLLRAVETLIRHCACERGCPSCTGAPLLHSARTKEVVLHLLTRVIEATTDEHR
jgi:ATP-dependent helicase YprA (DUF1998 family)